MSGLLPPFQMRFERNTASLQHFRLTLNIISCGSQGAPPMVKHSRDVIDSVGLFYNAEEKIVILGAIELGAESTHLLDQFAADEREMADVIAGEKIVGRPIRFKHGRIEASLGQFVFI